MNDSADSHMRAISNPPFTSFLYHVYKAQHPVTTLKISMTLYKFGVLVSLQSFQRQTESILPSFLTLIISV